MKVNIDMENLSTIIEEITQANVQKAVDDAVQTVINSYIEKNYKSMIETAVNQKLADYLENYFTTVTITIGGGWNEKDNPVQTYTIEEYIKKKIGEIMSTQKLTVKEKNRYGTYYDKEVSFEDFVKKNFDVSSEVKEQLTDFVKKTKNDINSEIKKIFDNTTRDMLSETVFNMLVSTDTYSKINNSIKLLGGN